MEFVGKLQDLRFVAEAEFKKWHPSDAEWPAFRIVKGFCRHADAVDRTRELLWTVGWKQTPEGVWLGLASTPRMLS